MKIVIFDLDGTLLDTSQGIFNSVRYAEKQLGLNPLKEEKLKEFLGPPPKAIYKKLYGLDEETALIAVQAHREYGGRTGIFEAKIYDGVIPVLKELRQEGYMLGVATLKRQDIAERILNEFDLLELFDVIVGMDVEETYTKEMIIRKAMRIAQAESAVVIGDSPYDYDGAKTVGVGFIGVLYGFSFREGEKYSFCSVSKPQEILSLVEGNLKNIE